MGKAATEAVIADRRLRVSRLLLRGYTLREIVKALEVDGQENPATKRPWSLYAVYSDKRALLAEWRDCYIEEVADRRTLLAAELGEVKRSAWRERKLEVVLRAIVAEATLLGLNGPIKVDLLTYVVGNCERYGLDEAMTAEVLAEAQAILREQRRRT